MNRHHVICEQVKGIEIVICILVLLLVATKYSLPRIASKSAESLATMIVEE
jgi:hypothetical protein